ncbi:MAG: Maf family protein [Candidatus Abyssubacteria bacterium]
MPADKSRPLIILASSSPRRIEILRSLGLEVRVAPSDVAETHSLDIPVDELVQQNALAKAQDVASRFPGGLIIGADTVVWHNAVIYGKPADPNDARRMLRQLAGKTHRVYSGVAVVKAETGEHETNHAMTEVTFRPLSDNQIERYLSMIDPLDKAGAYAIQGAGGVIVEKICGCYYNVVGLPLTVLDHLLSRFGMQLL